MFVLGWSKLQSQREQINCLFANFQTFFSGDGQLRELCLHSTNFPEQELFVLSFLHNDTEREREREREREGERERERERESNREVRNGLTKRKKNCAKIAWQDVKLKLQKEKAALD